MRHEILEKLSNVLLLRDNKLPSLQSLIGRAHDLYILKGIRKVRFNPLQAPIDFTKAF